MPGRAAFDPPEMLTSDLAPLAADAGAVGGGRSGARWPGSIRRRQPRSLRRKRRLRALGALDGAGADHAAWRGDGATADGAGARAHAAVGGGARRGNVQAARIALLLQERGLGGRGEDLAQRLDRWSADRSARAEASRKLAAGWAAMADPAQAGSQAKGARAPAARASLLAEAFPDNSPGAATRRARSG